MRYSNHNLYVIEGSLYFVDLDTNDFQEVSELADELERAEEFPLTAVHEILLRLMDDVDRFPELRLVVFPPAATRIPENTLSSPAPKSTDIPF